MSVDNAAPARPVRILVPGAGGPGTVNLCRSLKRAPEAVELVGTDCDRAFAALALTDEVWEVPRASAGAQYIDAVRAIVSERDIDVIVPNNSIEIRALAEHQEDLGAAICIPSIPALDRANSKWASWEIWSESGIPVPKTEVLHNRDDVQQAFADMGPPPVWVRGAGIPGKGIGVASLPCRTVRQAVQWVEYWEGWGGMIASELLEGRNLTWIGLYDHGRLVTCQTRERDRYVIPHVSPSGITGAPALSHTVHRDDVHDIATRAVAALDPEWHGVVFVDLKEDSDGVPRVTEANAGRFGTTHFFYTCAGLNLPWLLVLLALGRELPDVPARNPLPADLYWIRTLDAGPVLIDGEDLRAGRLDAGIRMGLHGHPHDSPPPLRNG